MLKQFNNLSGNWLRAPATSANVEHNLTLWHVRLQDYLQKEGLLGVMTRQKK
jgi:hypothetical protein